MHFGVGFITKFESIWWLFLSVIPYGTGGKHLGRARIIRMLFSESENDNVIK